MATKKTEKVADSRQSARTRDDYQLCIELLAEARKKAKVSESELARRVGKPQSWVAKSEDGTRRVDFLELIRICDALDVDPADLLKKCRKLLKPTRSAAK